MMPASVLYFLCLFYSLLISKTTAYFGGFGFGFNFLLLSCKTNNFLYKICSL